MSSKINNDTQRPGADASGPYETELQALADVAGIYARSRQSNRRGTIDEANLARLRDACERTGVAIGAFDARILAWLAGWEPQTCAVMAGLVTRAYAAGLTAAETAPLLHEDCLAGLHALCLGRLCQCPEYRHDLRRNK